MTVRYSADVFCDKCGNWVHGKTSDSNRGIARFALSKAKKLGWSRDNKSTMLDLCPACLTTFRKGG